MANLVNHHDEELGEVKILNVHDIYEIIYEINRIFDISGFESQLVGVWYWNREVTRSSPVEVLTSSGFSTQSQKLRPKNLERHFVYHDVE